MDRSDWTVPHSTDVLGAAAALFISKFHPLRCGSSGASWFCYAAARAASPFLDGSVQFTLAGEAFRPRGTTMSLTMTKEEREAFLADVHVAVISVAEDGHGPLVVPIWYSYEPGGEVRIITGRTSRKGKLLERAGRFSLCVQTGMLPYKYVSVEGPIVAVEAADLERDRRLSFAKTSSNSVDDGPMLSRQAKERLGETVTGGEASSAGPSGRHPKDGGPLGGGAASSLTRGQARS